MLQEYNAERRKRPEITTAASKSFKTPCFFFILEMRRKKNFE